MNNMSKNWKSILVYILIPILLIGAVIYFVNSQTSTQLTTLFRMFHISLMISGKVLINIMTSIAISRLFMTIGQERQMLGFTV